MRSRLSPWMARVTAVVCGVVLANPAAEANAKQDHLKKAFAFLYAKMDVYQTGDTPRLLETHSTPYPPNSKFRASVYDNALVMLALLQRHKPEDRARAKILGDAFVYAQQHDPFADGRIRDAYWATDITNGGAGVAIYEPGSSCGNLAWVINALVALYRDKPSKNGAYREAAIALGQFLVAQYKNTQGLGGFEVGYITDWAYPNNVQLIHAKSLEHNIDTYVAMRWLYHVTKDSFWKTQADHAYAFITQPSLFDATTQHYWSGTTWTNGIEDLNTKPLQQSLDANAYPILIGLGSKSLGWLETSLKTSDAGYDGFDFNPDQDGVWFEGTAVMAVVYNKLKQTALYKALLTQLQLNQSNTAQEEPAAAGALVSASHDGVSTGYNYSYYKSPTIQDTAWSILAHDKHNPLKTPKN